MTTRERFRRVMAGDAAVDRLPAIEWAYWWDKTLELWYGQGLPRGLDEAAMADFVGIDRNTQFWLPHKTPDCPRETSHGRGIVENESDYERLRPYLLPENAVQQMLPKIRQTLPFYENGQTLVWYTLDGFFWWPRTLLGIENHLYSFYDQPELYHRICEDLLEWQIAQVDALARYMKPDFMTIAEDMSYNHGPMLSEELFNEFIKPYYQRLIPEIKKHGTRVFVDSDGDVTRAVPWFRGAGVEGILPLERQSGVDVAAIRREYPDFLRSAGLTRCACSKGRTPCAGNSSVFCPSSAAGGICLRWTIKHPPAPRWKLIAPMPGCCGNTAHRPAKTADILCFASTNSSPRTKANARCGGELFVLFFLYGSMRSACAYSRGVIPVALENRWTKY